MHVKYVAFMGGGGGKEHLRAIYLNIPLITLDILCSTT